MSRIGYALFGGLGGFALSLACMLAYLSLFPPVNPVRAPTSIAKLPTTREEIPVPASTQTAASAALPTQAKTIPEAKQSDVAPVSVRQFQPIVRVIETTPENGYGIELGTARSFAELLKGFRRITADNAELELDKYQLRGSFRLNASDLEAVLMVGPFATMADAKNACDGIALPAGVDCRSAPFQGEPIRLR